MDLERHDFELDDLVEKIRANDNRLVALQIPEGLKMQALEMMDSIEDESDAKVILAADPSPTSSLQVQLRARTG